MVQEQTPVVRHMLHQQMMTVRCDKAQLVFVYQDKKKTISILVVLSHTYWVFVAE